MITQLRIGTFMIRYYIKPAVLCSALFLAMALHPLVVLPEPLTRLLQHVLSLCSIAAVAWLCASLLSGIEAFVLNRYDIATADNLAARKIHTQLRVIKRILIFVICIVGFSAMLMTFEKVRQLGTSLLASAGIAGIILGFAAQRSIATLFAGLQIAITQPIRIDDVVIVENEWGRIEEITLTYVVVRIWDLRRLVLPITYFTEKPFQNWTRVTADILGTVSLYLDYTAPVDLLRETFYSILDGAAKWDGKVRSMQVTSATDKTIEIRALMSAADASKAWDLRCEVREKLIAFIQKNLPGALPQIRVPCEADRLRKPLLKS